MFTYYYSVTLNKMESVILKANLQFANVVE